MTRPPAFRVDRAGRSGSRLRPGLAASLYGLPAGFWMLATLVHGPVFVTPLLSTEQQTRQSAYVDQFDLMPPPEGILLVSLLLIYYLCVAGFVCVMFALLRASIWKWPLGYWTVYVFLVGGVCQLFLGAAESWTTFIASGEWARYTVFGFGHVQFSVWLALLTFVLVLCGVLLNRACFLTRLNAQARC